ncbi:hypothetical protein GCM10009548_76030 [Streptomyces malaysiensis subsp. malaysiensis]|uniref:DUF2946 domain-containing protein n=1 Tax=Streptomyces malaysiensis TaxID=92644 RepID=A0ABX6VWX9_STRMQ|nr:MULTISPECIES: hypothetical protein [Streptomyces]QPI53902.1 hypothetical protein I1A49_02270 [Streptomyces solisilvae]UHH15271.1 hypothetical protein LUV23_02285 [Streptomyces sp. HNM0561]
MDAVYARGRAVARLSAVCAVLLGLFLMHGAPATAASGCHGTMPVSAPVEHAGQTAEGHHGDTVMAAADSVAPHAAPQEVSAEHGAQCVATPTRDRLLLPVWALVAVAVVAFSVEWPTGRGRAAGEAGRRGPPGGGRELLLRVCVARR